MRKTEEGANRGKVYLRRICNQHQKIVRGRVWLIKVLEKGGTGKKEVGHQWIGEKGTNKRRSQIKKIQTIKTARRRTGKDPIEAPGKGKSKIKMKNGQGLQVKMASISM